MSAHAKGGVTRNATARRVAALRARRKSAGLIEVNIWVPAAAAADLRQLSERLCADADLAIGPLRRLSTGKLVKL